MLRQIISGLAVFGGLARASTGTSYSFKTEGGCSTASGSGGTVPMSLPTLTTTSTVSSVVTEKEVTVPSAYSITAPVVTSTALTQTVWNWTTTTTTLPVSTAWEVAQLTVATATWPVTVCTNEVTPTTVTKYSGSYTPISGQVTTIPASYPTQVVCATGVTWFTYLVPTATSGVTTVTVTPTSIIYAPTTTSTITISYTTSAYSSTVTSHTTSYHATTSIETTSTACEATTTTTLAAKCAPTNIISGVDDLGLVSGKYADNATVIYIRDETYNDPSLCCQLCQDNEGCAAVMTGFSGYCGLYYVGTPDEKPICDFTFTYQSQSNVFPGQSLWVQSGCGEIEYTGGDGV